MVGRGYRLLSNPSISRTQYHSSHQLSHPFNHHHHPFQPSSPPTSTTTHPLPANLAHTLSHLLFLSFVRDTHVASSAFSILYTPDEDSFDAHDMPFGIDLTTTYRFVSPSIHSTTTHKLSHINHFEYTLTRRRRIPPISWFTPKQNDTQETRVGSRLALDLFLGWRICRGMYDRNRFRDGFWKK